MNRLRFVYLCATLMVLAAPASSQHPAPFPREGGTKVFENERVIVWDVIWVQGKSTPVHEHTRDLLSVTLAPGDFNDISLDGTAEVRSAAFGDFQVPAEGARAHRGRRFGPAAAGHRHRTEITLIGRSHERSESRPCVSAGVVGDRRSAVRDGVTFRSSGASTSAFRIHDSRASV